MPNQVSTEEAKAAMILSFEIRAKDHRSIAQRVYADFGDCSTYRKNLRLARQFERGAKELRE